MKVYSRIFVIFALYLTLLVEQNFSNYSNEAGYCVNYSASIACYIYNNETQAIKNLLKNGSQGIQYNLFVFKRYSLDKGYLTLDIEIPPNIRRLYLSLSYEYNHEEIFLKTPAINTNLEYITCDQIVKLESEFFFNQFVGLAQIYFSGVVSQKFPVFSQLNNLRDLTAQILTAANQVLDSSFLSNLTNLRTLNLRDSTFTSIKEGAFENMNSLSKLYLDKNTISALEDNAFEGLTNLRYLSLEDCELRSVSYDAFNDLTQLTLLNLNENPDFPLPAILNLQSLQKLYINYNNYQTIEPYVFQQMNKLTAIYMDNPFTCDCSLQWASVVSQFGIHIAGSYCLDPVDKFGQLITKDDLYSNCTQSESYKCFDSSVICENHEVCHNTEDSYYCGCPTGYKFNSIGNCTDIDECVDISSCQHSCVNTEGTFNCACNEGYMLLDNGYNCEDIDECQEFNGVCEHGCMNMIGSYQCYCAVGYQLNNKTRCSLDFTTQSTTRTTGTVDTTQQGTFANFLDFSQWANPTFILLILLFFVVTIQTIVIVMFAACILQRTKRPKNNHTTPAIGMRNLRDNFPINSSFD